MPKKVLFVITKSNWGGAQRYVYDLATSLPKEDFAVAVALGGHGSLAEKLKLAGVKVLGIPHLEKNINFLKELFAAYYIWKIICEEKPDIVHLNSSKVGGLGAVAAWIYEKSRRLPTNGSGIPTDASKLKIIFTAHGWAFNEDRSVVVKSAIHLLQWFAALLCDKVITISTRDYRQALNFPFTKNNKFALVPIGIRENSLNFFPKQKARRSLFGETAVSGGDSEEKLFIGTVAELTKNKGIDYLIDAVSQLQTINYKLSTIIIGDGEDRDRLHNKINALGLQNNILLAGFLPDAWKYIKAFDIFVLPSIKEGMPYTIKEAMAAKIPIIATSVGGLPDLIYNKKNGVLVTPKNPSQLADAIEKLAGDSEKRKEFAKNAHETNSKYSLEHMLAETIKIYHA